MFDEGKRRHELTTKMIHRAQESVHEGLDKKLFESGRLNYVEGYIVCTNVRRYQDKHLVRSPALHSKKDGTQKPEIVCLSYITEHLGSTATSKETVPESPARKNDLVSMNQCTPVRQAVLPVKKAIKTISKESENTNRRVIQVFPGLSKNIEDAVRYRRFGCPMSNSHPLRYYNDANFRKKNIGKGYSERN